MAISRPAVAERAGAVGLHSPTQVVSPTYLSLLPEEPLLVDELLLSEDEVDAAFESPADDLDAEASLPSDFEDVLLSEPSDDGPAEVFLRA